MFDLSTTMYRLNLGMVVSGEWPGAASG